MKDPKGAHGRIHLSASQTTANPSLAAGVVLAIYTLPSCLVCERLKVVLNSYLEGRAQQLFSTIFLEPDDEVPTGLPQVRPRMFPTLIAFVDGVPTRGWEGFAVLDPEEIQLSLVEELIDQMTRLASPASAPADTVTPTATIHEPD